MTNQEMLLAAIEFEEIEFSYDILYLLQEGIIDGQAEYVELNQTWNKVNKNITNIWMSQNVLGFDITHLYGVRINSSDWHLFFATDDSQARGYALNKLGTTNVIKFPKEKKLTSFFFPDTKEYKSIIELSKESNVLPRYALTI